MKKGMAEKVQPYEIRPGIFQLELPTPYPIGPVYTYLIKLEPITLVDVGVNSPESLAALQEQLYCLGLNLNRIEQLLLTHGHSDHYGAAQGLIEEGGKTVLIHPRDWDKVTDRRDYYLKMKPYLAQMGMPSDYLAYFVKFIVWETPYARDLEKVHPLEEGTLLFWEGLKLEVMHTPGHSPGHVVLLCPREGWAITGDFIFTHITPDPIIDITPSGFRTPSMPLHLESLKRFAARGINTFFPGHREKEGRTETALEELRKRMEYKKKIYMDTLKEGALTPFQIMRRLYPQSRKGEAFVLLSEVMGRLDLLEMEGVVTSRREKGLILYSLKEEEG